MSENSSKRPGRLLLHQIIVSSINSRWHVWEQPLQNSADDSIGGNERAIGAEITK